MRIEQVRQQSIIRLFPRLYSQSKSLGIGSDLGPSLSLSFVSESLKRNIPIRLIPADYPYPGHVGHPSLSTE